MLSAEQLQQFNQQGFLAIHDFASHDECDALKARANELVDSCDPEELSIFSTTDQEKTTTDYFMHSSSNVSYFFEQDAFDARGALAVAKAVSLNKIGHALHDLDPVFREFSRSKKMQALYRALGFERPLPVQSMYIFKQPKIGGEVVPHQDSAFLTTEPLSCVGVWLAVEDATVKNGCLFVADESHNDGVQARLTQNGSGGVHWANGPPDFSAHSLTPLETPKGTLVLLHGSNVHGSNTNSSKESRHAYSMHVVEGKEGVKWLEDNWLQRGEQLPFEPLYS